MLASGCFSLCFPGDFCEGVGREKTVAEGTGDVHVGNSAPAPYYYKWPAPEHERHRRRGWRVFGRRISLPGPVRNWRDNRLVSGCSFHRNGRPRSREPRRYPPLTGVFVIIHPHSLIVAKGSVIRPLLMLV